MASSPVHRIRLSSWAEVDVLSFSIFQIRSIAWTVRRAGFGRFVRASGVDGGGDVGKTHTTICLRPSRGLRMNLRVRRVTGESESAILTSIACLARLTIKTERCD